MEDDGSLRFLRENLSEFRGRFHSTYARQEKLVGKNLLVLGCDVDVTTKRGKGRYKVYVEEVGSSNRFYFFTSSHEMKSLLDMLSERNLFPRSCVFRKGDKANEYYLD